MDKRRLRAAFNGALFIVGLVILAFIALFITVAILLGMQYLVGSFWTGVLGCMAILALLTLVFYLEWD